MISKKVVFRTSFLSLLISLRLHYAAGIVIDENNLTGAGYYGGEVGLLLSWLRLLLLLGCVIASAVGLRNEMKR